MAQADVVHVPAPARRFIVPPATKSGGLRLVFDVEADDLLDTATVIHCVVIVDLDSAQIFEYGPGQIADALAHLARARYLTGHKIKNYDLRLLRRLYGWTPSANTEIVDTLVAGRLILPNIGDLDDQAAAMGGGALGKLRGRYSVEAWGVRLGVAKVGADIEDFSVWTPELQARCVGDANTTKAIWHFIRPDGYSAQALELEHRAEAVCDRIEADGVPFDDDAAGRLERRWSAECSELALLLRRQFPDMNPSSRAQVARQLETRGWIPEERTEKTGQAKIDDELLEAIPQLYPEFAGLADYHILKRRIAQLSKGQKAWRKHVGEDGRIHGGIVHIGTPHGRAAHFGPNLAQVPNPKRGTPLATECRALFQAPERWTFVTADQATLQDRAFAHYLTEFDGGDYAEAFLGGVDQHWKGAIILDLIAEGTSRDKQSKVHEVAREGAKGFRYGFLFGCQAKRAGQIINKIARSIQRVDPTNSLHQKFFAGAARPSENALRRVGRQALDKFEAGTPGLRQLRQRLQSHARQHGWLPGLDGRRVPARALHSALNFIVTSAEAILCKRWLVQVHDELCARFHYGWDGDVVIPLWIHDELACCCRPEIAAEVGEIMVRHAREAGTFYGLKVPLDADFKVGRSWGADDLHDPVEFADVAPSPPPLPDHDGGVAGGDSGVVGSDVVSDVGGVDGDDGGDDASIIGETPPQDGDFPRTAVEFADVAARSGETPPQSAGQIGRGTAPERDHPRTTVGAAAAPPTSRAEVAPPTATDAPQAEPPSHPGAEFLAGVFGGSTECPVFVCSLINSADQVDGRGGERFVATRAKGDVAAFAAKWDLPKRGLFFCVATIRPSARRRAKDTLAEINCLHADLDFDALAAAPEEARRALRALARPPSTVTASGHGLHLLWLLDRAIEATPANVAEVERLLKRLTDLIGADPAAAEVARLLRLPGSHNSKRGGWVEVVTEVCEPGRRYRLDDLRDWIDGAAQPLLHRRPLAGDGNGQSPDNPFLAFGADVPRPPVDVDALLAAMRHQGPGDSAIHPTQLSVSAALINRGTPVDQVVEILLAATRAAAGDAGRAWSWEREERELRRMCRTWIEKHPEGAGEIADGETTAPSAGSAKTHGRAAGTSTTTIGAWPKLDPGAYYGLAGEVVNTLLPCTESDPAALLLQYLTCFGNMVGRQPFIRIANADHYPNIFALIVGRTARSRKGTSAQDIRAVMERADPDWVRENIKSGISSGEGIIEMVRDARYEMDKKTQTLVCVDPGVSDKRLLLDEREFSSALSKMKQETNIVSRVLREAWDCVPPILSTRTKHKPSIATEPLISMAAHITVDELRRKLEKLSLSDGFGNRFLYTCTDRSKLLPFGGNFDPAVLAELGRKTNEAVKTAQTRNAITFAEEAKPVWAALYAAVEGAPLTAGLIDHLTARAAPQMLRLSMLYALLDSAPQIAAPHIQAAHALWRYCEASAGYIFSDTSGDHVADTLMHELELARPDGISRRDIIRDVFGGHTRAYEIIQALRKLEAAGKARCQKQQANGPGRPREMWFAI